MIKFNPSLIAKIVMDRVSGRSRGFAFVTYTSSEEASNAINALDGKVLVLPYMISFLIPVMIS